jgi:hypothetical protein
LLWLLLELAMRSMAVRLRRSRFGFVAARAALRDADDSEDRGRGTVWSDTRWYDWFSSSSRSRAPSSSSDDETDESLS